MRRTATLVLFCSLFLVLPAGTGLAQIGPPEDHFKVYDVVPPVTYTGQIGLFDQFGDATITNLVLEKFATPAIKNNEEWYDLVRHQTWWKIDQTMPIWKFDVDNQFGLQPWYSYDAAYLVLPALKNQPGELPIANHYKCYYASGPALDIPVNLVDQFGDVDVVVVEPVVFCNPVEKVDETGMVYPIVDQMTHLACYRIDPRFYGIPVTAFDQFGTWSIEVTDQQWLCVPSYKLNPTPYEQETWGRIKQRYTN